MISNVENVNLLKLLNKDILQIVYRYIHNDISHDICFEILTKTYSLRNCLDYEFCFDKFYKVCRCNGCGQWRIEISECKRILRCYFCMLI